MGGQMSDIPVSAIKAVYRVLYLMAVWASSLFLAIYTIAFFFSAATMSDSGVALVPVRLTSRPSSLSAFSCVSETSLTSKVILGPVNLAELANKREHK
jgi:hypothetical protein